MQARQALNEMYAKKESDLNTQLYSSNLSAMGSAFGAMGDLVKGYAGENSSAYKTMIAAQKQQT